MRLIFRFVTSVVTSHSSTPCLCKCHSWAFIFVVAVVQLASSSFILIAIEEGECLCDLLWIIIVSKYETVPKLRLQSLVSLVVGAQNELAC